MVRGAVEPVALLAEKQVEEKLLSATTMEKMLVMV